MKEWETEGEREEKERESEDEAEGTKQKMKQRGRGFLLRGSAERLECDQANGAHKKVVKVTIVIL